jgi:hypothetical protein
METLEVDIMKLEEVQAVEILILVLLEDHLVVIPLDIHQMVEIHTLDKFKNKILVKSYNQSKDLSFSIGQHEQSCIYFVFVVFSLHLRSCYLWRTQRSQ